MMRAVKLLTWLSFSNFLGLNEVRYSKDQKKKSRIWTVLVAYLILGVMLVFYTGLITYALFLFDMTAIIPAYLAIVISILSFMFTVFSAGPTLFSTKSYEFLITLPIKPAAIVISRFLTMYFIDMAVSVLTTATVLVVCGFMGMTAPWFYLSMALSAFIFPLLPMTAAMIIGTGIYALTSRMRRKNLMQILFSMTFLAVYFVFMQNLNGTDEELVSAVGDLVRSMTKVYPPAFWFSEGVFGNILLYLLFFILSVAVFLAFALIVGRFYQKLCTSLVSQSAKRNYVMKAQRGTSAFRACFYRERKRYFASSIYVMNTLVGYIMVIVFSVILLFSETGEILSGLLPGEILKIVPFVIALLLNMAPTTVSAFSMEGKHFWLTQSLPLRLQDIINAKLLVNLMFAVPSALISSILLLLAFRPTMYVVWFFVIPLVYVVFGSVLGLWINMKAPMMTWDMEAQVVKQSKATLLALLLGAVSVGVPLVAIFLCEGVFVDVAMAVIVCALLVLTYWMYRKLLSMNLNELLEK